MHATATHAAKLGCPEAHQAVVESAGVELSHLSIMTSVAGFSWQGLVAFLIKWGPLGKEAITAVMTGGSTLLTFAITNAVKLPEILTDLLAVFAVAVAVPPPDVSLP